jgi:hypothetical protein
MDFMGEIGGKKKPLKKERFQRLRLDFKIDD